MERFSPRLGRWEMVDSLPRGLSASMCSVVVNLPVRLMDNYRELAQSNVCWDPRLYLLTVASKSKESWVLPQTLEWLRTLFRQRSDANFSVWHFRNTKHLTKIHFSQSYVPFKSYLQFKKVDIVLYTFLKSKTANPWFLTASKNGNLLSQLPFICYWENYSNTTLES